MLCHGSVRVEQGAKQGPAVMRVEFPAGSTWKSFATDIPVAIQ
jgi:hypothetical protein